MRVFQTRGVLTAALCLAAAARVSAGWAGQPDWNVFAGREQQVTVTPVERLPEGAARAWFRISKEGRAVASGTARVEAGGVMVPVSLPALKPGIAMRFDLELRAGTDQGASVGTGHLWAFSEQPLVPGHRPAGERKLLLYDPEGSTAKAFHSIGLACETVARAEALTDVTNTVVVVGEGVSLESERGLGALLTDAAVRGNRVLLLAPKDGALKPPERHPWLTLAGAAKAVLGKTDMTAAGHALDLGPYPPGGAPNKVLFKPDADAGRCVYTMSAEDGLQAVGWDFKPDGGRFRACGLGVIENWDKTPAMRWFLVEMIEQLSKEE